MKTLRKLGFSVAAMFLLVGISRAEAGIITLDLGTPTVVGSIASFDVFLTFDGDPGDILGTIGLNPIHGSSPALADLSRWSFSLGSQTPLNMWSSSNILGTELLTPDNLFLGPFIEPGSLTLGTLSVDLSGLTPGSTVVASLNSPLTGGIGVIDGMLAISGLSPNLTLQLGQPLGVPIDVPGPGVASVPEPSSLAVLGFLSVSGTFCSRRFRKRPGRVVGNAH